MEDSTPTKTSTHHRSTWVPRPYGRGTAYFRDCGGSADRAGISLIITRSLGDSRTRLGVHGDERKAFAGRARRPSSSNRRESLERDTAPDAAPASHASTAWAYDA